MSKLVNLGPKSALHGRERADTARKSNIQVLQLRVVVASSAPTSYGSPPATDRPP